MKSRLPAAALFCCVMLTIAAPGSSDARGASRAQNAAESAPEERCGRALVASQHQVLTRESAMLSRCIRAIVEQHSARIVEYRCGRLARTGIGADRVERIARRRVHMQCSTESLPLWFAMSCHADGPEFGKTVSDPIQAASCALSSGRCMAFGATKDLFGDVEAMLRQSLPELFSFELGGVSGHTFEACFDTAPTTTTTLPTPSTTTTTTTSTTTIDDPTTTTLPQPTTTTTSTTLPAPEAPSIVVTEIMTNPAAQSDTTGEYFEVANTGTAALDLLGMSFRDLGSNSFTVSESVVVAAGARAVLARSVTAADGAVDYIYGSAMSLGNSADQIIVELDGVLLDEVAWDDGFPLVAGAAMELAASATDPASNDAPSAWCASATPLSDGDFGTPGAAPGACLE